MTREASSSRKTMRVTGNLSAGRMIGRGFGIITTYKNSLGEVREAAHFLMADFYQELAAARSYPDRMKECLENPPCDLIVQVTQLQ